MSSKNVNIIDIVASWLIVFCHTGKFSFPVVILKYLSLKNYWANFLENYTVYCKEVLVNEINVIINLDKFSHSYDNLYLCVTFIIIIIKHVLIKVTLSCQTHCRGTAQSLIAKKNRQKR